MTHPQVFGQKFTPIRRFLAWKTHPFWPHIPNMTQYGSAPRVLGIVQNGKLGVGKTRSLVKRLERALRGFHLRGFRFGYSAKWKTRSLVKRLETALRGFHLRVFRFGYSFRPRSHVTGYDSYPGKLYADRPCVHTFPSLSA